MDSKPCSSFEVSSMQGEMMSPPNDSTIIKSVSESPSTSSAMSMDVKEEATPTPVVELQVDPPKYKLLAELQGCNGPISSVKFSPDGTMVASGCADKTFRVWEARNEYEQVTKCRAHLSGINDVSWSPNSRCLATCSDDSIAKVYDLQWTKKKFTLRGHSGQVVSIAFNQQGTLLVTAAFDNTAKVWDTRTGQCVSTLEHHSKPLSYANFKSDGSMICTTSYDGSINIWDTRTFQCLRILEVEDSDVACGFAKFSPNGRYILIAHHNSKLRLVDLETNKHIRTYSGHQNTRYCISADFSLTGKHAIVSGSEDGYIYVWDMQTGDVLQQIQASPGNDVVVAVDCHPNVSMIASGTAGIDDKLVRLWRKED